MFKFVTIYRRVEDEEQVEAFFAQTHLPLAEQLPGLRKTVVSRITGKPGGESRYYLMYELYFATSADCYHALQSNAGLLMSHALKAWSEAKLITWFYADVWEEEIVYSRNVEGK